jgi:hypothetical protein
VVFETIVDAIPDSMTHLAKLHGYEAFLHREDTIAVKDLQLANSTLLVG